MKNKLSAVTRSLIVTVLAIYLLGWNCEAKLFTANTAPKLAASNIDSSQFEMPIIVINTISQSEISSNEEYTDVTIDNMSLIKKVQ
jgi:hypothetical protein